MTKRLHLAALLPITATLLCLLRYWQQGDSNVWTKSDMHLYVADQDLGWRRLDEGLPWLGLDSLAFLLLFSLLTLAAARFLRKRSSKTHQALWVGAGFSLLLPIWAFLGGAPIEAARTILPTQPSEQAMKSIEGHLPGLPAGRYEILMHKDTSIVTSLVAGGEAFDVRWSRMSGSIDFDPANLKETIEARFAVDATEVDSNLAERDEHIRDYLESKRYPELALQLHRLLGTQANTPASVSLRADATLQLMGKAHPVLLTGQLSWLDPAAQARLAVSVQNLLLLKAHFTLDLASTAIKDPEDLFDSLEANIHVTLLLHPKPSLSP